MKKIVYTLITGSLTIIGNTTYAAEAKHLSKQHATTTQPPARHEYIMVVGRASPAPQEFSTSYQPTQDASTLRTTTSILNLPQVVNAVSAQIIRDQQPRNLDDALANVSGITQGNTLAGTQDTVMKRGFGGNRDGSIMHNGMPLVQGRAFNAAASSVEVLKGPSSLLYGIMDPGGVVNVISKKPLTTRKTILSASGSTYAHNRKGFEGMLDTTGPIGTHGLAYRLVVDRLSESYWRNFGQRQETLVAPSLAWYGTNTHITAWYEFRDFRYPFDRGTVIDPRSNKPINLPARRRLDEPFNAMQGQTHLAQLSWDQHLFHQWNAHVNFSYNQENYDANQLRVNGINTTKNTLSRSNDGTQGAQSTDTYGMFYIDGPLKFLYMRHDLQFGMDAEHRRIYRQDMLRQKTTSVFNYEHPVYGLESPSQTVSASDSDQTDSLNNVSGFIQDSVRLTHRLILSGGVRYLTYNQHAGKGRPFKENTRVKGDAALPRAGIVYKVTRHWSLYGSYSESLKPTSTIAPLSSGMVLDGGYPPERGRAFEVGTKILFPGHLTGTLALFDIHKKNVLVSQYNTTTKLTDYRTAGAAMSRGVELDLAGQVTKRLSLISSYAYLDGKTTKDPLYAGKQLWNAARHTASFTSVYTVGPLFSTGMLRIGAGMHYVGKRPGDSANSFFLPRYVTGDLFATYSAPIAGHNASLQFNIKNIANTVYYPSSANAYFVSMGDARRFSLRGTIEF